MDFIENLHPQNYICQSLTAWDIPTPRLSSIIHRRISLFLISTIMCMYREEFPSHPYIRFPHMYPLCDINPANQFPDSKEPDNASTNEQPLIPLSLSCIVANPLQDPNFSIINLTRHRANFDIPRLNLFLVSPIPQYLKITSESLQSFPPPYSPTKPHSPPAS